MSKLQNNITNLQSLLEQVNALPEAGTDLPELTNPADASKTLSGYEFINEDGEKVTGTFSLDTELSTQDSLIAQIQTALEGKASASEPVLQAKTVTPTTSSQSVKPDSGYDGLSNVTVNAIPSTYVKPSATKAATTYTPSTSNQTIAAGTYCSGVQTIKGDANLKAENIKSGVSIFGITGTASSGSSSSGGSVETCTGTIMFDGPSMDTLTFYYVNSNMELVSVSGSSQFTFSPIKNSIIYTGTWSSMASCSGAQLIRYHMQNAAFFVTGNFTLTYIA